MDVLIQVSLTILSILVVSTSGDHEYMVNNAEPITVPLQFRTELQCMMNIEPDKFQWKFYPLPKKDAFNPKAIINLSKDHFQMVPLHDFTTRRTKSDLTLQSRSIEVAGDYQCLAYYGASVVASVPWRVTIATLGEFPPQDNLDLIVTPNNTVTWRCEPPEANPEPLIDYYKDATYLPNKIKRKTKSLILEHVEIGDSGRYSCRAGNPITDYKPSLASLFLRVVPSDSHYPPRFVIQPRKIYTVIKGDSVFLECSAIGNPAPTIVWRKEVGQIPYNRTEMLPGGLLIRNVSGEDGGTYTCTLTNLRGSLTHQVTLVYSEKPSIECILNSTDVKQGEHLDLECSVKGKPEPQLSWFLNGFSVINDTAIEAIGEKIYFRPVEKRHAGNLQLFARNIVKTVYSSISIKVIPLSQSVDVLSVTPTRSHHNNRHPNRNGNGNGNRKNQKHPKCIPPTKPSISRLNDETVVVRWNVSENKGLPIQFFKVQYRELGSANYTEHHLRKSSKWMTANTEIASHIRSYEVNGLKPDHIYRFRIAAVYTNNDNKIGPTSEKFHLSRNDFDKRNPLPVPLITHTETINSTSVKLYWKCEPLKNISIDGFFINYISASRAGDYTKTTVDGEDTSSVILSHLLPDTFYDVKLQSFNSETASEFSSIMKAKTAPPLTEKVKEHTTPPSTSENTVISKLYITIAVGVVSAGLVIILVVGLLLYCRKWKQKKNVNRNVRDKPAEDHHIQADGNEYVVGPKSAPRMNGSGPPNRITITANPLADADNKNQNMIEMSCLSSQNNNCSAPSSAATTNHSNAIAQQPSASGGTDESVASPAKDNNVNNKKIKNNKRIRNKNVDNPPGENYV